MVQATKSTSVTEMTLDTTSTKPNLKGDRLNFLLLMLLYIMQGVNFGVSVTAIPIILQSKKVVTFEDQAFFSLALWPNSMKILWAPIVDSLYIQRIGRRKSWLLPVQFAMGINLLYLANHINEWLPETGRPNIEALTYVFLIFNIFSATLDIVYGGWTVTMLNKANASYSSVSKSTGMALGIMLGSVVPVLFSSEKFCNSYLRSTPETGGILTLESFLIIWGYLLIILTTLIGIFKKEKNTRLESTYAQLNIINSYKLLWDILQLPNTRLLLTALFTMQIGTTAIRSSFTNLQLIDAGVPKDSIMLLTLAMFAVKILTPLVISKYTTGPKPMSLCMKAMLIRLLWSFTFIPLIHYTPMLITHSNKVIDVPMYYYLILGFINAVTDALTYYMLVTMTTFFTRISDSHYSGTYMTLLNTTTNLSISLSSSLGLQIMDYLAINCSSTIILKNIYNVNKDDCPITIDSFYVEVVLCVIIGFSWYGIFKNTFKKFQIQNPFDKPICFNQPDELSAAKASSAINS